MDIAQVRDPKPPRAAVKFFLLILAFGLALTRPFVFKCRLVSFLEFCNSIPVANIRNPLGFFRIRFQLLEFLFPFSVIKLWWRREMSKKNISTRWSLWYWNQWRLNRNKLQRIENICTVGLLICTQSFIEIPLLKDIVWKRWRHAMDAVGWGFFISRVPSCKMCWTKANNKRSDRIHRIPMFRNSKRNVEFCMRAV